MRQKDVLQIRAEVKRMSTLLQAAPEFHLYVPLQMKVVEFIGQNLECIILGFRCFLF